MGRQAQSDTGVQTLSPISVKYTHPELLAYPPPCSPQHSVYLNLGREKWLQMFLAMAPCTFTVSKGSEPLHSI